MPSSSETARNSEPGNLEEGVPLDVEKQQNPHGQSGMADSAHLSSPASGAIKTEHDGEKTQEYHTWDGPDDPDHPQNWALAKKLFTTVQLAFITFTISINSAMFAPASRQVMAEFGVSEKVATLGTSLYLLGFCFGPPFWGPISEKFGRKVPMLIGSGGAALFSLMSGFGKHISVILIGRFIAGSFGAAPAAIVSGAATDNWGPVGRGINLTAAVGSIFGAPLLGPIVGGFIVQSTTWRWTMWVMTILGGSVTAFSTVFLSETYPPVLLKRRTKRLRKETGDETIKCTFDEEKTNISVICFIYLVRPWVLFCTEPILVLVTLYQAFIYGILYLFISAYPYSFGTLRHWSPGPSGLPLFSLHLGILTAVGITVYFVRTVFTKRLAANAGKVIPEQRLPLMILGACLFPIGLFWFAWTATPSVPYPASLVSGLVTGCGMFLIFIQCIAYLIEVYLPVANSAMASNSMVRALFGAGFPLFAQDMYRRLGVSWATSTLAFIAIALAPVPVAFWWYGGRIRGWSRNAVGRKGGATA